MLKVTNLNYTVDGTQILHDVSLEVHPGEFVGILGPNGSGKSTLLKNIYKVLKPQSGAIELQGKNLLAMSNREMAQHLAVVGQEHEGSFDFLVEEVVLMGCQARKRLTEGFDESDRQAAMKALRRVELEHLSQRSYLSLSGGEKQRVMIARALVQDTPLMILDEPTNHLDVRHQLELIDYLHRWTADGTRSVIGIFHDVNLALRLTDNVLFMKDGRIVRSGAFSDVADAEFLGEIYETDLAGYMRSSLKVWESVR